MSLFSFWSSCKPPRKGNSNQNQRGQLNGMGALLPSLGEGSYKNRLQKKGTLILTFLLDFQVTKIARERRQKQKEAPEPTAEWGKRGTPDSPPPTTPKKDPEGFLEIWDFPGRVLRSFGAEGIGWKGSENYVGKGPQVTRSGLGMFLFSWVIPFRINCQTKRCPCVPAISGGLAAGDGLICWWANQEENNRAPTTGIIPRFPNHGQYRVWFSFSPSSISIGFYEFLCTLLGPAVQNV